MADESDRKEGPGFIVIDRRGRSDDERPDQEAARPPETGSAQQPPPAHEGQASERPGGQGELPQIDFATFVLSLSTSALYHLGLVADPETKQPGPVNRELARQTIDTLEMLQRKTKGNLEPEEEHLLESLLYELRMRFVEGH